MIRWRAWRSIGLLCLMGGVAACGEGPTEPDPRITLQGVHVVVSANADKATLAEAEAVLARAESLFSGISSYVGPTRFPWQRIPIELEGDPAGSGSRLDVDGVHLVRHAVDEGGYLAVLAHEMAHAFGASWFIEHEAWNWPTYRYFDEGFAEYVAQEVDPAKHGFPFYGFPEDAVAGHWLSAGLAIPAALLRIRHEDFNERCNLQAYTLRASWMRHLEELAGRDALLAVVYPDEEPTDPVLESIVGLDLESLDQAWQAWLEARFALRSDASTIGGAYAERTPWYRPCEEGIDY